MRSPPPELTQRRAFLLVLALILALLAGVGWLAARRAPATARVIAPPAAGAAPHSSPKRPPRAVIRVTPPGPPQDQGGDLTNPTQVAAVGAELGGVTVHCPVPGDAFVGPVAMRVADDLAGSFPQVVVGYRFAGELWFYAPADTGSAQWVDGAAEGTVTWPVGATGTVPCTAFATTAILTGIHGVVREIDGGPAIDVSVTGCGDAARSDADGTFFVAGRVGACGVYATRTGADGEVRGPAVILTLAPGVDTADVVLVAPPPQPPILQSTPESKAENCRYWRGAVAEMVAMVRVEGPPDQAERNAAFMQEILPAECR